MKKTALTIGLFSLVAVATSFATPVVSSTNSVDPKSGYPGGIGQKKVDVYASNQENVLKGTLDFSNTNQSLGSNKKVD